MSLVIPKPAEQEKLPRTAFDELEVSQNTPITQITAQYGLLDNVFTATIGGTVSTVDSNFVASSGATSSGIAVISTRKQVQYKAGQGIRALFTAVFDTPKNNNTQFAGLQNSESLIGFGYNGTEFGIGFANDGALSIQELKVTTPASGSETATVTIDGNAYLVNIAAGSVEFNASQIANSLNLQVPGYDFTANEDTVTSLANLPQLGLGTFSFSSATAVAAWIETNQPKVPTQNWTPISQWTEFPDFSINPQTGNVFKIQFPFLGYGNPKFFIKDQDTGEFVHVHTIKYTNKNVVPSVPNPIFRVGWISNNTGNLTDVSIRGASAAIFVEGENIVHGSPIAECAINTSVGATATNIVSLRNRMVLNSLPNRASISTLLLSLSTETPRTAIFEVWKSAVTPNNDPLLWEYENINTSIAEYSKNAAEISGGDLVGCFFIKAQQSATFDLTSLIGNLGPQEYLTVSARINAGSASEMAATIAWKEDK